MLRNGDSYTCHNFCDDTIFIPETQKNFTEEILKPAVNMEDAPKKVYERKILAIAVPQ